MTDGVLLRETLREADLDQYRYILNSIEKLLCSSSTSGLADWLPVILCVLPLPGLWFVFPLLALFLGHCD